MLESEKDLKWAEGMDYWPTRFFFPLLAHAYRLLVQMNIHHGSG
jgi:hypothetical protein